MRTLIALLLVACTGDEPAAPVSVEPVPDVPAAEPAPPPKPAAPAGPLWLRTETGLFRVDAPGVTPVVGFEGEPEGWALHPEGNLWFVVERAIYEVVGDRAEVRTEAPEDLAMIGLSDVAFAPDGTLWAVGPRALASWDGQAWTSPDEAGIATRMSDAVAVHPSGDVFVLAERAVLHRSGTAWSAQDMIEIVPGLSFLDDLTITPDGRVWATFSGDGPPGADVGVETGLLVWKDGTWSRTELEVSFDNDPFTLSVAKDGSLVAIGKDDDQLLRGLPDAPATTSLEDNEALARELRGISIDDNDRVWAFTDKGLMRIGADGTIDEYAPGTMGLPQDELVGVLAQGGGPALGASEAVAQPVRGRILKGDTPVADATMAICDRSDMMFQEHPCENAELRIDAKTDADGAFSLPELEQARYELHVLVGEQWTWVLGAGCCLDMKADTPMDLGDIVLEDKKQGGTP